MTEDEFAAGLDAILSDGMHHEATLTISQIRQAFVALRAHRELGTGLFPEGSEPNDDALYSIFAMLVLP